MPNVCKKCARELPEGSIWCCWCGAKQVVQRGERHRSNGEGTVFKLPSGRWRAELRRFTNGQRYVATKEGFARKKDALEYIPTLRAQLDQRVAVAQGHAPPDPLANATVELIHAAWERSAACQRLSESKRTHYRTAWQRMEPTWRLIFTELRLGAMQQVLDACPGGYYPKRDIKSLYSHLYKFAIRNELTERNRAQFLDLPEHKATAREAWQPDEVAAWWRDYRSGGEGSWVSRIILIMIYTGMRTGEVRALDPARVHLDEQYLVGGIKTEAGIDREIPLADCVLPLVREALQTARYGLMPVRIEEFYDAYADAVERVGVRPLAPYSCRHTTATALAEQGVPPAIIKAIMGHTNYATTLGYTHISAASKVEAVNTLLPGAAADAAPKPAVAQRAAESASSEPSPDGEPSSEQ